MRTGLLRTHSTAISLLTRVLDVLLVLLGGVFAYYFRFGFEAGAVPLAYAVLMLIGGLLTAVLFPLLNVYHSWRARGLLAPAARVFAAWCLVFLTLLALLVLAKLGQDFSRLWMALWAGVVAFMLMGLRIAVFAVLRTLRQRGYNRRRAVVVGSGPPRGFASRGQGSLLGRVSMWWRCSTMLPMLQVLWTISSCVRWTASVSSC